MSQDDDIERLLREVDSVTSGQPAASGSAQVAKPAPKEVDKPAKSGSRQPAILAVSAVSAALLFVIALFLPFVPELWVAVGAFVGSWLSLTLGRRFT